MAARSFVQLLGAADPGVVVLGISFVPNGTSAIATSAITGRGVASVAWSTNKYVVTLADVYPSLLSATVTLQLDNATAPGSDQYAVIGAVDLNAKTIDIVVRDVSGAGTTNLSNANKVHLCLVLKNSQV